MHPAFSTTFLLLLGQLATAVPILKVRLAPAVDDITCNIAGMQITDPQATLTAVQRGTTQPPTGLSAEEFSALLLGCISGSGGSGHKHSAYTSNFADPTDGSGGGEGSDSDPSTFGNASGYPGAAPSSAAAPPAPGPPAPAPAANNPPPPPAPSASGSPAGPPVSAADAPATNSNSSGTPPSPPAGSPPSSGDGNAGAPSPLNPPKSTASNAAADHGDNGDSNANTAAPANSAPANPAPPPAPASAAPQPSPSPPADSAPAPATPSPDANADSSASPFLAYNTAAPAESGGHGDSDDDFGLPRHHQNNASSKNGCDGIACVADVVAPAGVASAPELGSNGLTNGSPSGCPSGDIDACLNLGTR